MRSLVLIVAIFTSYQLKAQTDPCQLIVKVENIKKVKGSMKFGVYNQDKDFLKTAVTSGSVEIKGESAIYTFEGLKKGMYAVSIFQDENENGKLDANFMGIPSEPYAFSNNARGRFGPPSFEDCRFEVSGGRQEITISL